MKETVTDNLEANTSTVFFQLRHRESGRMIGCQFEIRDEFELMDARRQARRVLAKEMRERGERWDDYEYPA